MTARRAFVLGLLVGVLAGLAALHHQPPVRRRYR